MGTIQRFILKQIANDLCGMVGGGKGEGSGFKVKVLWRAKSLWVCLFSKSKNQLAKDKYVFNIAHTYIHI